MSRKWFHHQLRGKEAEALLLKSPPGSFLVRRSGSSPGDFTLGVKVKDMVTHIKIRSTGDYFDLNLGEKFATLTELIDHYMENPNQIVETNGNIIDLKYPVMCEQETPNERWFHGQLSGADATNLLLTQGVDGSYLVRESERFPGSSTLSVRCGSRVTHVKIVFTKRKYELSGVRFNTLAELVDYFVVNPIVEVNGGVLLLRQPLQTTRFTLQSLSERVSELEQLTDADYGRAGFSEEFEMLQQQSRGSNLRRIGTLPENKDKNRFKNILPFDHSRVCLKDIQQSKPGADYINANYITNMKGEQLYIAAQGPLSNTIGDFWQMVYENDSKIIINTTALVEKERNKSVLYWPTSCRDPLNVGNFTIKKIEEIDFSTYVRRAFIMRNNKHNIEKRVWQFHFIDWPDHGVPKNGDSVLNFLDDIREHSLQKAPGIWTLHCSAGIGRTGTFIAIDVLKNIILQKGSEVDLDVQKIVLHMRAERSGMVQTEAQYKFVYCALLAQVKNQYRIKSKARIVEDSEAAHAVPSEASLPDESIYGSSEQYEAIYDNNAYHFPPRNNSQALYDNQFNVTSAFPKGVPPARQNPHSVSEPLYDNNNNLQAASGGIYDNTNNLFQKPTPSQRESIYDNQSNVTSSVPTGNGGPALLPPTTNNTQSNDIYDNTTNLTDMLNIQQSKQLNNNNTVDQDENIYDNNSSVLPSMKNNSNNNNSNNNSNNSNVDDENIYDNNSNVAALASQFSPSLLPSTTPSSIPTNKRQGVLLNECVLEGKNSPANTVIIPGSSGNNNNNNNNNSVNDDIYDNSANFMLQMQKQQQQPQAAAAVEEESIYDNNPGVKANSPVLGRLLHGSSTPSTPPQIPTSSPSQQSSQPSQPQQQQIYDNFNGARSSFNNSNSNNSSNGTSNNNVPEPAEDIYENSPPVRSKLSLSSSLFGRQSHSNGKKKK